MIEARERELRSLVHLLASVLRAEQVVVWEKQAAGLVFAFGYDAPQSAVFKGLEAWEACQDELSRGRTVEFEGHTFRPALASDCALAAVVQSLACRGVDGRPRQPDPHDESYVEWRLRSLVAILRAPGDPVAAPEDVVMFTAARLEKPAGRSQVRSMELLAALRRAGWNIAQTARQFGVTDQTVRNWMRALGLTRAVPSPFDPRAARTRRA